MLRAPVTGLSDAALRHCLIHGVRVKGTDYNSRSDKSISSEWTLTNRIEVQRVRPSRKLEVTTGVGRRGFPNAHLGMCAWSSELPEAPSWVETELCQPRARSMLTLRTVTEQQNPAAFIPSAGPDPSV